MEALQEAEEALMTFCQGKHMMNGTYLDKFCGLIECYEHHGGQPGMQTMCIQEHLDEIAVNPAMPTTSRHAK